MKGQGGDQTEKGLEALERKGRKEGIEEEEKEADNEKETEIERERVRRKESELRPPCVQNNTRASRWHS